MFRGNGNESNDFTLYATGANTVLTVTGNTFESGWGYAMRVEPSFLHRTVMANNVFSGVGENRRILFSAGAIAEDAALSLQSGLEGYVLEGQLAVASGVMLTAYLTVID